jgi:hypothetical protein
MRRFTSPLNNVTVAAPCPADWDSMIGSERVRFCGQCELNVYNLSAMSCPEAESLITRTEGRLCVRFYRRKDGSIITEDCPVGLRALKRRASRIKRAIASSILGFLAGIGLNAGVSKLEANLIGSKGTYGHTQGVIALQQPPINRPAVTMGGASVLDSRPTVRRLAAVKESSSR